jgi:sugar/nucleoside kinase (ribokinase family)
MALAATAMSQGVSILNVTLGPRGVIYFAAPGVEQSFDIRKSSFAASGAISGPIRTSRVPAEGPQDALHLDPTGCGDVWGATYFAHLLAGAKLGDAMRAAMHAAARNVTYRGASGLASYLRGELSVK